METMLKQHQQQVDFVINAGTSEVDVSPFGHLSFRRPRIMASELRVNTLKDASGNNSIATSFVASGSAKAWSHLNGTGTPAFDDSFNHASITDKLLVDAH